jgi:hypothetical protein
MTPASRAASVVGPTPGPWVLAESVENKFSRTNMRRIRCETEGYEHGAVCEVYGINDGTQAAANARLIAAAPDLLAALEAVVARLDQPVLRGDEKAGNQTANILRADIRSALVVARAALSKARGLQEKPG